MKKDEFINQVYDMHLQNLNGAKPDKDMFFYGIEACFSELTDFIKSSVQMPEAGQYVLIKTENCSFPALVAKWNGVNWIDTEKAVVLNVTEWRNLFIF